MAIYINLLSTLQDMMNVQSMTYTSYWNGSKVINDDQ